MPLTEPQNGVLSTLQNGITVTASLHNPPLSPSHLSPDLAPTVDQQRPPGVGRLPEPGDLRVEPLLTAQPCEMEPVLARHPAPVHDAGLGGPDGPHALHQGWARVRRGSGRWQGSREASYITLA